MAWFISYRHSLRPDETGLKFVPNQAQAVAEGQWLEAHGYLVTRVAEIPPGGPAAIVLSA